MLVSVRFFAVPKNQSVVIGSEVTFRCAAENADADLDRISQWRTNTGHMLGHDAAAVTAMSAGRYSYQRDSSEQLNLHISNVSLADDGTFECQMMRREIGGIRSSATLNVLGECLLIILKTAICWI